MRQLKTGKRPGEYADVYAFLTKQTEIIFMQNNNAKRMEMPVLGNVM